MHLLVPQVFLLPIVVELISLVVTPLAVAWAWLPLRVARRSVVTVPLGSAYRDVAHPLFDVVPLPDRLLTPKGEHMEIDPASRRARIRLKFPRRTQLRVRIVDGADGFALTAAALPVPLAGLVVGAFLAATVAADLAGPSIFFAAAIVFVLAAFAAHSCYVRASARLEELADALAAHVEATRRDERAPRRVTSESPSPETSERPSPTPPEATARRSSSSD